jgi:hypothetical protein
VTAIAAVAVLQWHGGQGCSGSVRAAVSQRTDSACAECAQNGQCMCRTLLCGS